MLLRHVVPWLSVLSLAALGLAGREHDRPAPRSPAESASHREPPPPLARTYGEALAERSLDCPPDMVLVDGHACPEVEQRCLRWLDSPNARFAQFRCAEYAPPRCLSQAREHLRFCIDRDESRREGETLPENRVSLRRAEARCGALGKRVCDEREWTFACEGEAMSPYPYGQVRDTTACNADRTDLVDDDGKLRDLRAAPGAHPRCTSPFGVRDMTGNLEEVVARAGADASRVALKGSYWQPGRNHCRAAQYAHDAHYAGVETGFRCCSDPAK